MTESQLSGSVVRALVSYRRNPGSIPSKGTGNFQLCFTLLRLSCRKRVSNSLDPDKDQHQWNQFTLVKSILLSAM